jgi:hypothetical protein
VTIRNYGIRLIINKNNYKNIKDRWAEISETTKIRGRYKIWVQKRESNNLDCRSKREMEKFKI